MGCERVQATTGIRGHIISGEERKPYGSIKRNERKKERKKEKKTKTITKKEEEEDEEDEESTAQPLNDAVLFGHNRLDTEWAHERRHTCPRTVQTHTHTHTNRHTHTHTHTHMHTHTHTLRHCIRACRAGGREAKKQWHYTPIRQSSQFRVMHVLERAHLWAREGTRHEVESAATERTNGREKKKKKPRRKIRNKIKSTKQNYRKNKNKKDKKNAGKKTKGERRGEESHRNRNREREKRIPSSTTGARPHSSTTKTHTPTHCSIFPVLYSCHAH